MFKKPTQTIREHHTRLTSTQDRAKEAAKDMRSYDWQVITADEQTRARGTHGRVWVSPPSVNLYATFMIPFPASNVENKLCVPQVVAYSIIETLMRYGLPPELKWINDVLLDRKKVAGVLCELVASTHLAGCDIILVGVGININMDKTACDQVDAPATSLMLALGRTLDKEELLTSLTTHLMANIQILIETGFDYFYPRISSHLAFRGEQITVKMDDAMRTSKQGVCEGVDSRGRLLLNSDGKTEPLLSGRI